MVRALGGAGRAVLVASCIWVAAVALGLSPIGAQFDRYAHDWLTRWTVDTGGSSAVVAGIDERTLAEHGGLGGIRGVLAELLARLASADPSVVAVDVVLAEPGSADVNARLAGAIAALKNVVLAANLTADGQWTSPGQAFSAVAAASGHVHSEPDFDGICRRIALAKAGERQRLWALSVEAFRVVQGTAAIRETAEAVYVGDYAVPASAAAGRPLWIRFGRSEPQIVSAVDLMASDEVLAQVRGKAVFVGMTAAGSLDRFLMTPTSRGEARPGVAINAAAYATIAGGDFLRDAGDWLWALSALVIAVFAALCRWRLHGWRLLTAALALVVVGNLAPVAAWWSGWVTSFAVPAGSGWLALAALTWQAFHKQRGELADAESRSGRYEQTVRYMSHELRTPLTAIQGSSELIAKHELSDDQRRQMAELIHAESKRLGGMLETFLRIGKLSVGALELEKETIPLKDLVSRCCERAEILGRKKGTLLTTTGDSEIAVHGDREMLELACYNLITNAIKYSPAHTSVSIRVRGAGINAILEVSDEGPGIPASEQKKIFRRYYRTGDAVASGVVGTGLGLSIVDEIVSHHEGSVEVDSHSGNGSTFRVVLPGVGDRATAPS